MDPQRKRPVVAFCITCKGRSQHLKITLPKNLEDNKDFPDCKFIVLDYSSTDDSASHVFWHHRDEIASGRLVLYYAPGQEKFRMAHAKNTAHRLGMMEGADILVNLDADNFTGPGFARYIVEQMSDPNIFLWAFVSKKDGSQRGISGRIVVTATQFLLAGGYDERFETWAPDDKDFNRRLRLMGFEGKEIDECYLGVILHNDKMRFKEYPQAKNGLDCTDPSFNVEPDNRIANFGNIGCATVLRNFDPRPIEVPPLPTRIFGIGMHKTATTSLHHALEMLGYDSAHWTSAHWAKAIWREMNQTGRSITVERNYAMCDLPMTLLYKQLDAAYPGSKFILTKREENGWVDTVEKHWSTQYNRFRHTWDHDPFSHRIHKILYGRQDFDRETMLERYRRHNQEVLDYFKGREKDLLVMDMDAGAGWKELCDFFHKPIPDAQYPHSFAFSK